MAKRTPRPQIDWVPVRSAYDAGGLSNDKICELYAISASQLRYQRELDGWVSKRARKVSRADLINRMLRIFEKQLTRLEKPDMSNADKEIGLLSTATKTLEKIIEIQDAEQPKPVERRDMADLRDKLAERIDQLKKR